MLILSDMYLWYHLPHVKGSDAEESCRGLIPVAGTPDSVVLARYRQETDK